MADKDAEVPIQDVRPALDSTELVPTSSVSGDGKPDDLERRRGQENPLSDGGSASESLQDGFSASARPLADPAADPTPTGVDRKTQKTLRAKLGLGRTKDGALFRPTFEGADDADYGNVNSFLQSTYRSVRGCFVHAIRECLVFVLETEAKSLHETVGTTSLGEDGVIAQMTALAQKPLAHDVDKSKTIERAFLAALRRRRRGVTKDGEQAGWSEEETHDFEELLVSLICKQDVTGSPLQHLESLRTARVGVRTSFDAAARFDDSRLLGEPYTETPRSEGKRVRGANGVVRIGLEHDLSEVQACKLLRGSCLSMLRA
jgi:hypothetical protein